MTSKFIHKNMKEENSHHRPEQMLLAEILRKRLAGTKSVWLVRTEYPVQLNSVDGIESSSAVLDIAIIPSSYNTDPDFDPSKKSLYALRLMGPIHEKKRRRMKDDDQRILLLGNHWKVKDIWYNEFQELWEGGKHSMEELDDIFRNKYGI